MSGAAPLVLPEAALPFLVTHGAHTWVVLWALSGALGVALALRRLGQGSRRRSALAIGLALVLGLAVGLGGLWGAGQLCARWGADLRGDAAAEIGALEPLVIAAALPGSRAQALERLRDALSDQPIRDQRTVARLAALAGITDGCAAESWVWLRHRHPELAAATARICGDRAAQVAALVELGDYAAAAEVAAGELRAEGTVSPDEALIALIVAGRYAEAARVARLIYPRELWDEASRANAFECLWLHLEHRAGDRRALAALAALARGPDGWECGPLVADLLTGQELRDFVRAWRADKPPTESSPVDPTRSSGPAPASRGEPVSDKDLFAVDHVMGLLAGFAGEHLHDSVHAAGGATWRDADHEIWTEHEVLTALAIPMESGRLDSLVFRLARPLARVQSARPVRDEKSAVMLQVIDLTLHGLENPAAALRRLGQARLDSRWRGELDTALRLRAGELDVAAREDSELASVAALRAGRAPRVRLSASDDVVAAGAEAARAADGEPLAARLRERSRLAGSRTLAEGAPLAALVREGYRVTIPQSMDYGVEQVLFAVAPRLRRGRSQLVERLAWREDIWRPVMPLDPCDHLVRAALRRDLFAWLGDAARSQRWGAIARRHLAACTDRDAAIALWMVTTRTPRIESRTVSKPAQ